METIIEETPIWNQNLSTSESERLYFVGMGKLSIFQKIQVFLFPRNYPILVKRKKILEEKPCKPEGIMSKKPMLFDGINDFGVVEINKDTNWEFMHIENSD